MEPQKDKNWLSFFTLFSSSATLICCALPALLVALGAGATLASLMSVAPWLSVISKYKIWVFLVSGLMLVAAGVMKYKSKNQACPADKDLAEACSRTRKISNIVFYISVAIWLIGFFFAYIAVHVFY